MKSESFQDWLRRCPLVAILRGIKPAEALDIASALIEADFCMIEVPLNSPDPFASIMKLSKRFGDEALIGAGTVTDPQEVAMVSDAGGKIIVMPHADERVVQAAKRSDMFALPGFATPTEAFRMIEAGADAIKLFPAEANPPRVLKALRAILPKNVPVLPVGGITPGSMREYWEAGANGFGLGSALYKPGDAAAKVAEAAREFQLALKSVVSG